MTEACRVDVWLWRARFARTRSAAAAMVEDGRMRLTHRGVQTRLDKPSRSVHVGDVLLFSAGTRLMEVEVLAFGERRGPAEEARSLWRDVAPPAAG
ncbi:RNA-binding S4 domain-containing protein [Brevundimonas sp.]|uniref:RNA-binding S4 domain-containing protein n=1 Tax=Brevundimonas sp. TaxID=1871086 RepID=UPI002E11DBB5|nr:S4 domain-containing protein [Brevundimonas sp.]